MDGLVGEEVAVLMMVVPTRMVQHATAQFWCIPRCQPVPTAATVRQGAHSAVSKSVKVDHGSGSMLKDESKTKRLDEEVGDEETLASSCAEVAKADATSWICQ